MTTLSPRGRRLDGEMDKAIHERNARHVVELVNAWGLTGDEHAPVAEGDDVRLHFDGFDRGQARTVADVWRG